MRNHELEQCGRILQRVLTQLRSSLDAAECEVAWLLVALEQTEMELPWRENGSPHWGREDRTD